MSIFQKLGLTKSDEVTPIETKKEELKFPEKQPFFDKEASKPTNIFKEEIISSDETNPYLDNLRKVYEDGFTKLNKPDIDFFELYQALTKSGNLESAEALKMAYSMCSTMNPSLTKEILNSQANQYAKSLMDSYNSTKLNGENKLASLNNEYLKEKDVIEQSIKSLELQLQSWKQQRDTINSKFDPQIKEIKLKSEANNIAYSEISDRINKVQSNIKNNL